MDVEEFYFLGVAVAFAIRATGLVAEFLARTTILHGNMKRFGRQRSWWTGQYSQETSGVWGLLARLIFFPLELPLSWLSVFAWVVSSASGAVSVYFGMPQHAREFRWRVRNIELSAKQMERLAADVEAAELERYGPPSGQEPARPSPLDNYDADDMRRDAAEIIQRRARR